MVVANPIYTVFIGREITKCKVKCSELNGDRKQLCLGLLIRLNNTDYNGLCCDNHTNLEYKP
jgi:hypothetical protein